MTVEVGIDVALLKREIKKTYASVSDEPEREFIFPTGRAWAEDLGYPAELANVPETVAESFAGVANLWELGRLADGERVLDLGRACRQPAPNGRPDRPGASTPVAPRSRASCRPGARPGHDEAAER